MNLKLASEENIIVVNQRNTDTQRQVSKKAKCIGYYIQQSQIQQRKALISKSKAIEEHLLSRSQQFSQAHDARTLNTNAATSRAEKSYDLTSTQSVAKQSPISYHQKVSDNTMSMAQTAQEEILLPQFNDVESEFGSLMVQQSIYENSQPVLDYTKYQDGQVLHQFDQRQYSFQFSEIDPYSQQIQAEYNQMVKASSHGISTMTQVQNLFQNVEVPNREEKFIETVRELGDGMQAKTYLALSNQQEPLCVKVFKTGIDCQSQNSAEEEFRICQMMQDHPNIVNMHSYEVNKPILVENQIAQRDFLTLEFCPNGDLFEYISNYVKMQNQQGLAQSQGQGMIVRDLPLLRSLYLQLINGISAMHHMADHAHMDIKLENVLITGQGLLQFCDFGFSCSKDKLLTQKMGTAIYMAPEIHNAKNFPCKAQPTDIFSMGVMFFMLAFGAPPFHSAELSDGFFSFLKMRPDSTDFFKFHPHTRQLYHDNLIPESFMQMILAMLRAEPTQRIQEAEQLLESEFFKNIDVLEEMQQGANKLIEQIASRQK